jgi:hypothetical protein
LTGRVQNRHISACGILALIRAQHGLGDCFTSG